MNDNPYASQGQPAPGGGYQNRQGGGGYQQNRGGFQNRQGGGGGGNRFQKPQQKEWTPEELQNAHFQVNVVVSGNENFPPEIGQLAEKVVKMLEDRKIIVRTSNTRGLNKHISTVAKAPELHIPFKLFDNCENPASYYTTTYCQSLAKNYLPDIDHLPKVIQAIYAANPRLLFGKNLDRAAQLTILWSEDGCEQPSEVTIRSGIAGHLVKLSASAAIPVINLQRPNAEQRVQQFLEQLYVESRQAFQPQRTEQSGQPTGTNPGTYVGTGQGQSGGGQQFQQHDGRGTQGGYAAGSGGGQQHGNYDGNRGNEQRQPDRGYAGQSDQSYYD